MMIFLRFAEKNDAISNSTYGVENSTDYAGCQGSTGGGKRLKGKHLSVALKVAEFSYERPNTIDLCGYITLYFAM